MDRPFFSIIMPTYNKEKYVKNAINSVIGQTFKNWELVVVDDCSKDSTYEILQEISKNENRIKVYKTQTNSGGPSIPRNIGLEKATGKWICFLDPDNLFIPTTLEELYNLINKYGDDYTYCSGMINFNIINGKINPIRLYYHKNICGGTITVADINDMAEDNMIGVLMCINSELIKKYNIKFDTTTRIGEDLIFDLEIRAKGVKSIYIDKPLLLYGSLDENSITKIKNFDEIIKVAEKMKNIGLPYASRLKAKIYLKSLPYFFKLQKAMSQRNIFETIKIVILKPYVILFVLHKIYRKKIKDVAPLKNKKVRKCVDEYIEAAQKFVNNT